MDDISFEKLLSPTSDRVIFRAIWGSYAYGTNTPESDRDTIGVFMMERHHYLAIGDPVRQIADTGNDNRFYTLKNYLELAANANPNILDSLFLPPDCILKTTVYWQMLQEQRRIFVPVRQARPTVNTPCHRSKKQEAATSGSTILSRKNRPRKKGSAGCCSRMPQECRGGR